jgi:hypothetical protein
MFDYQAGEKYKLTLIMVAIAGLMAGMFLSILMMPTPEPPHRRQRPANDEQQGPPIRSAAPINSGEAYTRPIDQPREMPQQAQAAPQVDAADPLAALNLVQQWLPLAWDLSAGSAQTSQEKAILYMTPECADAYRRNIWTDEIARQIDESGVKSSFNLGRVSAGANQPDGSVVIFVEGQQVLAVPGKGSRARDVKLQYLVKTTADGLRIAGISEVGKRS